MQGAKRSDTRRYREHLQRRSAPVSGGRRGCDFSDAVDYFVRACSAAIQSSICSASTDSGTGPVSSTAM